MERDTLNSLLICFLKLRDAQKMRDINNNVNWKQLKGYMIVLGVIPRTVTVCERERKTRGSKKRRMRSTE